MTSRPTVAPVSGAARAARLPLAFVWVAVATRHRVPQQPIAAVETAAVVNAKEAVALAIIVRFMIEEHRLSFIWCLMDFCEI